jgi:lipopolysaccharide transport system permease protein
VVPPIPVTARMRLATGHVSAFREIIELLTRHRDLTLTMARRELSDRYAGQVFGVLWAIGHPLFQIALYVFVFAVVFRTRIGGTVDMPLDYPTYLLAGMVAWVSFQESMVKSCTAITSNEALVKQVVFPLEILPVKGVLASLLGQLVSLAVLIVYVLVRFGGLHATYALLPVLIVLQLMAMIGVGYVLSVVGVYFRDLKDFVQVFAAAAIYMLPVFYLPQWVPAPIVPLLYLNPFSHLVWCYQDALYFGRFAHPWSWAVMIAASIGSFVIGYRVFRKLKPGLANQL